MSRWLIISMVTFLTGCGVDAVGTAAVTASAKAHEAEQAQKMKEDVQKKLDEAAAIQQRRMEEIEGAAGESREEAD